MELQITHSTIEDIPVITLRGHITIGEGSVALRNEIGKQCSLGLTKLIINLEGVSYIDSSGIHELVESFRKPHISGIAVAYTGFSQKIIDLLSITKIITIFDVFETNEEAVKYLKSPQ